MTSEDLLTKLVRQNEVIISLLGRLAFNEETVKDIVIKNKRVEKREQYLEGYNACNGNRTLTEIAKIIGVSLGTLSPILQEWEDIGIIYEVYKAGGKFYKKIFPI